MSVLLFTLTQRGGGAETAGGIRMLLRATVLGAEGAEAASLRWPLTAEAE